jgi:hypothetical protein
MRRDERLHDRVLRVGFRRRPVVQRLDLDDDAGDGGGCSSDHLARPSMDLGMLMLMGSPNVDEQFCRTWDDVHLFPLSGCRDGRREVKPAKEGVRWLLALNFTLKATQRHQHFAERRRRIHSLIRHAAMRHAPH